MFVDYLELGIINAPGKAGSGCAQYPADEVVPTEEEIATHAHLFKDLRWLARLIAAHLDAEQTGMDLCGELGYAYQHADFECNAIASSMLGFVESDEIQQIIDLLNNSGLERNYLVKHLVSSLQIALEKTKQQEASF